MRINQCSVTVMRSHDYCHFSVTLGAVEDPGLGNPPGIATVDELRKVAARLADKAVEQYKIKKAAIELSECRWDMQRLVDAAKEAEAVPEAERTPAQQACIKALADRRHQHDYDYQDDWEQQS